MNSTIIKKILTSIISILIIYLLSFLLFICKNNELVYPNPNHILYTVFTLLAKSSTYRAIFISLVSLIICVLISFIISLILSYFSYKYNVFYYIINPYIILFRSTPVICISVLFIILFGHTYSVYLITNLMLIPLFFEGLYQGFQNIDKNIVDAYRLDSQTNIKILFKVFLPINISYIKMLLIEGFGLGFKVLLMSEYLGNKDYSLGSLLFNSYQNNIDMTEIYAYTILILIISLLISYLTKILKEKR